MTSMNRKVWTTGLGLALLLVGMSVASSHKGTASNGKSSLVQASSKLTQANVKESVGKLPLAFEQNQGQTDPQVKYVARASGYTAFLTENETVLSIKGSAQGVLRMKMQNARPASKIVPGDKQIGKTNYVRPQGNITGIPNYGKVTYKGIYPGIDVAYRGNQRDLEYDFVVSPGADPNQIRVAYEGSSRFVLDGDGNLELETAAGRTLAHKPVVYQTIRGVRKPVQGDYVLTASNQVGFKLGAYDHSQTLVIDPVVSILAFLNGVAPSNGVDQGFAVATNPSGTPIGVFLTGRAQSLTFITAASPASKLSHSVAPAGNYDAYVIGLDGTGKTLVYTTFLGAGGDDNGEGIVADNAGNAYVTGYTNISIGTTPAPVVAFNGTNYNAFVAKFSSAGALTAITYFGGPAATTQAFAIAQDNSGTASNGNVVIGGLTDGLTAPNGEFKTFAGGTTDGFIATFNPSLALQSNTYLGGSSYDQVNGVAVDFAGNIYAAGITASGNCLFGANGQQYLPPNFPTGSTLGLNALGNSDVADFATTPAVPPIPIAGCVSTGQQTAFVTKYNAALTQRRYSSIFGAGGEAANSIAVDPTGVAYVVGSTRSIWFDPLSPNSGAPVYSVNGSLPYTPTRYGSPIAATNFLNGFAVDPTVGPVPTQGWLVSLKNPNAQGNNQGSINYVALQAQSATTDVHILAGCNLNLPRFGGALGGVPTPCIATSGTLGRIESWNAVTTDADGQVYIAGQRVISGPNYAAEIIRLRSYNLNSLPPNALVENLSAGGIDTQAFGIAVSPFREAFFIGDTAVSPAGTTVAGLGSTLPFAPGPVPPTFVAGINNSAGAALLSSQTKTFANEDVIYGAIQFLDAVASPTVVNLGNVGLNTPTGIGGPTATVTLTDTSNNANTCVGGSINGFAIPGVVGIGPFTVTQLANSNSFQVQLAGGATSTTQPLGPVQADIFCPLTPDNYATVTISANVVGPLNVAPAATLTGTSVVGTGLIAPYTTLANGFNQPYQQFAGQVITIPVSVITPGALPQSYQISIQSLGSTFPTCPNVNPPGLLSVSSNGGGQTAGSSGTTPTTTVNSAQPVGVNPTFFNGGIFNVNINSACAALLPAGQYQANVLVANALSQVTTTLPFSLTITSGGVLSQFPLNLGFLDKTSPAQQTSFSVNAQGSSPLSYGVAYLPGNPPANPLPVANVQIVSGGLGTVPAGGTGSVIVQVTPTGLAAGIYMGTFYVTLPGSTNPLTVPCPAAGTGCIGAISMMVFVGANGVPMLEPMIPGNGVVSVTVPAGYPATSLTQPTPTPANLQISAVANTQVTPLYIGNVTGVAGITAPIVTTPASPLPGSLPTGYTACFVPLGTPTAGTPLQQPPCEIQVWSLNPGNTCAAFAPSPQYPGGPGQCNYQIVVDTIALPASTTPYTATVTFTATSGQQIPIQISVLVTQFPGVVLTQLGPPAANAGLPLTGLLFNGVAGQNVTTCQSFTVDTTGGTVPNVTMSTTNSFLAVFVGLPPANFQFLPGYFNSISLGNLTFPGQVVSVCANSVGQPANTTLLRGMITIAASGVSTPVLLPVTYNLTGGTGNPNNLQQLGTFRSGTFFLDVSVPSTYIYAAATTKARTFGQAGDIPVAGDFFGTGVMEIGVYRPSTGTWYIDANNNGVWDGVAGGDFIWTFGQANPTTTTDYPIVGDWTGDGKSKIGVMRCPLVLGACTFYLDAGNKHAWDPTTAITATYGQTGDIPVANNWNHTGMNDQIGAVRCAGTLAVPGVCTWYVNASGTFVYNNDPTYLYGQKGDLPIVGNWFGTTANPSDKRIGAFRGPQVFLNLSGTNVYVNGIDFVGNFGAPGDLPVIGLWTQFP